MMFLHLFNQPKNVDLCTNLLYIGDTPFVSLLSRFTQICVPMYLFLSGYGLFISFENKNYKKSHFRILSLWLNYILILAIFVFIGMYVYPEKYPGSFLEIILNVTTFSYSYNAEWWFLFPYFILVLISPFLFKWINKTKLGYSFFSFIIIGSLTQLLIKYNFSTYFSSHELAYKSILVLSCLFPFGIGALFAKENIIGKIYSHLSIYVSIVFIILVIIIKMFFSNNFLNPYVAVVFIVCFSRIKKSKIVNNYFEFLGKHSTNIWLIHTFFCYYLFKIFIYSFKYPLLIFIVLLLCSILSSYIINLIYIPLNKLLVKFLR